VVILYAGNRGYLDEIPVGKIRDYEKKLYAFIEREHPEIFAGIADKKALDKHLDEAIAAALEEFGRRFREEAA